MFNFFQKKKKDNRPDSSRGSKVKVSDIKPDTSSISKKEEDTETKKSANTPQNMIMHISEKSSDLGAKNSYVFKIEKNLNKPIVKKSVEKHYGVKVESVHILNTGEKKRIRGNTIGYKPGYKKAIVKLKEGHAINF